MQSTKINTFQANALARKIITLIEWRYGLRSLALALEERLTFEQYQWALRGLATRDIDKKMSVAYWCLKKNK